MTKKKAAPAKKGDKRVISGKTGVSSGINPDKSGINPPVIPGKKNSGILSGKIRDKSGTPGASGGVFPDKPIGPGNPPAKNTFKPGVSGNPKGYPKGRPNAKTVISYWLGQTETVENPLTKALETMSQLDVITLKLLEQARKGNIAAYRELVDRTEGKPVQSTKLLDANDKALEITIGFKAPEAKHKTTGKGAGKK